MWWSLIAHFITSLCNLGLSSNAIGPTQLRWVAEALSTALKQPEREVEHSLPSTTEVKNESNCSYIPPHAFMRSYAHLYLYRGANKSLARLTSKCILFDGENIPFDVSLVIYINSTNIPPIMIINRIYETQNLLSLWLVSFLVGLRNYQHPCTWYRSSYKGFFMTPVSQIKFLGWFLIPPPHWLNKL